MKITGEAPEPDDNRFLGVLTGQVKVPEPAPPPHDANTCGDDECTEEHGDE